MELGLCCLLLLCGLALAAPPAKREEVGLLKGLQPAHAEAQIDLPARAPAKFPPRALKRPAHLEAVPIERDGSLNKDFKRELILGKDTNSEEIAILKDRIDELSQASKAPVVEKDPSQELSAVFEKADSDKSGRLSKAELEAWIGRMTQHHLDEAVAETKKLFALADADGDERVTWDEFHNHFLVEGKHMSPGEAAAHKEADHAKLDQRARDEIEDDEEKWREAEQLRDGGGALLEPNDAQPPEEHPQGLTFQQFLGFRHPEHSDAMLTNMAQDILASMDKDGDGRISRAEWIVLPAGDLDNEDAEREEAQYIKERMHEFDASIDANKDGFVGVEELKVYSNPRNPGHAKAEVAELFEVADVDKDGELSRDEVLAQKGLFMGSGMVDPGRVIHHEL